MRTGPKALVGLGLPAALRPHAPKKGVGGPYPAPSGYRWAQVAEDGQPVTEDGQPVMELQRIAA